MANSRKKEAAHRLRRRLIAGRYNLLPFSVKGASSLLLKIFNLKIFKSSSRLSALKSWPTRRSLKNAFYL